jgi:putative restriction endonuclease
VIQAGLLRCSAETTVMAKTGAVYRKGACLVRIWTFFSSADREYAGNDGYDDGADRYSFDSLVGNSRRVSTGDLVVMRDRGGAYAVAVVEELRSWSDTKALRRCPVCGTTVIKERTEKLPRYRCRSNDLFDNPKIDVVACTKFEVLFGDSARVLNHRVPLADLRPWITRFSAQGAIQELSDSILDNASPAELRHALQSRRWAAAPVLDSIELAPYSASDGDERSRTLRAISSRRGQAGFRKALLELHHGRCAVSGCTTLNVLEAAHISPYRGSGDQHVQNGILLRADLHTLFDLDLLGIDPTTRCVSLHPEVSQDPLYSELNGKPVSWPSCGLDDRALTSRWSRHQRSVSDLDEAL